MDETAEQRGKRLDYYRAYWQVNKEDIRRKKLVKQYGITVEQYDEMVDRQQGLCAICHQPETSMRGGTLRSLCIDHCHASGRVRGLLCARCNGGLGCFSDDLALLQRAIAYLDEGGE